MSLLVIPSLTEVPHSNLVTSKKDKEGINADDQPRASTLDINELGYSLLAIWLVDTALLSGDGHWRDCNILSKMAAYRIAIMNEDIGKFVYDGMQQRTKDNNHKRTSLRTFTVNVFNL